MFLLSCLFLCLNVGKPKKIDCPHKTENVPHNFSQEDKMSPNDQTYNPGQKLLGRLRASLHFTTNSIILTIG